MKKMKEIAKPQQKLICVLHLCFLVPCSIQLRTQNTYFFLMLKHAGTVLYTYSPTAVLLLVLIVRDGGG